MERPIGIFDSGIGGLTVFKSIATLLPYENLLYLGDTARVPYGTKSSQTVCRYAVQNVRFLLEQKVKLIVVACNTASAFAMAELERSFDLPIVGVIQPGVDGALAPVGGSGGFGSPRLMIGVIGTEGTIQSGVYTTEIKKRRPETHVFGVACPLFVPLVEEGMFEGEITLAVARRYLSDLSQKGIDSLILGCTHYPLLKATLRKILGDEVALIDSAEETAREVRDILREKGLLNNKNAAGRRTFFVTDHPDRFRKVGALFLGTPLEDVQQVDV